MKAVMAMILAASLLSAGCSGTRVERVDAQQEFALTDKWNAKDSQLVAESMIDDMLSFPWIQRFQNETGKTVPTVVVQNIYNKSSQQIAVDTFINDLKRAALRSGKVDFVVSGAQRDDVRDERKEQAANASADTAKPFGEEVGADFALSGTINSMVDQLKNRRVTYYQTDLVLIDMRTNREVWAGQNKIQKIQEKSRIGF